MDKIVEYCILSCDDEGRDYYGESRSFDAAIDELKRFKRAGNNAVLIKIEKTVFDLKEYKENIKNQIDKLNNELNKVSEL